MYPLPWAIFPVYVIHCMTHGMISYDRGLRPTQDGILQRAPDYPKILSLIILFLVILKDSFDNSLPLQGEVKKPENVGDAE